MKILVTGGTGFLGSSLAKRLVKEGYQVTIVGRNRQIGKQIETEGITFIQADLNDQVAMAHACQGQDYVFHSGALSSLWRKYQDFYETNVIGTKNMIAGCQKYNIKRLIHVSSPSIYSSYRDRLDIKEDDLLPDTFINDYAQTKYLAEQEIDKAYQNGLPVITIRPRAIFGPGDRAIIPRLIKANEKIGVPIIYNARAMIDFTYIDNVVDALLLCMNSPVHTLGKKYNITNDHPMVLHDILEELFQTLNIKWRKRKMNYRFIFFLASMVERFYRSFMPNKEPVLTKYTVSVLAHTQTLNIAAAKGDLGYVPRVSIDEGIEKFAKWWEEEHGHKT